MVKINLRDPFPILLLGMHIVFISFFLAGAEYEQVSDFGAHVGQFYQYYLQVGLMIFVGFGYLMTYPKHLGLTATGFTFMISCFVAELSILLMSFWHMAAKNHFGKVQMSINMMIEGMFGAATVLISFGAVLGRMNAAQLSLMAVLETFFYSFNFYLVSLLLRVVDIGGSLVIHTFGAYFGLAVSFMLTKKQPKEHAYNVSTGYSDTFAMIGTVFLWLFWPSFNGAFGTHTSQFRVIVNTFLSLTSACIVTFAASRMFRGDKKFDMVHIQNATLAGGVAMGTCADLIIGPGLAMLIGSAAGLLSTAGYKFVQPMLLKTIGLKDTCGVHNLHGMPGLLGGLAGAIATSAATPALYGAEFSMFPWGSSQSGMQIVGIGLVLVLSIVFGLFTGFIINKFTVSDTNLYNDAAHWEMEEAPEVAEPILDEPEIELEVVGVETPKVEEEKVEEEKVEEEKVEEEKVEEEKVEEEKVEEEKVEEERVEEEKKEEKVEV